MGTIILITIAVYFTLLSLISFFVSRNHRDNNAFFRGSKKSPWYIVAFGMIGSSISGVTFVSVPGMVGAKDMTYMQMVFGMLFGYLFIAYVLLPLYYKLNLTTIYGYLQKRFGNSSYKTGASFFILSKTIGAAARLYLVVFILHSLVFQQWGIPFMAVAAGAILLIWLYTFQSGIKTIVWTDTLQTFCMLLALGFIIYQLLTRMELNPLEAMQAIAANEHARIFVFEDWFSTQIFWKQFVNGMLIAIVMNGLDQDMMQKSLTIENLKGAQKNMVTFGLVYIPVNFLFLCLGVLLLIFAAQVGLDVTGMRGDAILPSIVTEYLGLPAIIFFSIGIIAAAFSSIDSAVAALTTTVCVDLLNMEREESRRAIKTRRTVHVLISFLILFVIYIINQAGQQSILGTIYKVAAYTYGPLLGLFAFGLFTKYSVRDRWVPLVCVLAPLICYLAEVFLLKQFGYASGDEILLLNGLLTIIGLLVLMKKSTNRSRLYY